MDLRQVNLKKINAYGFEKFISDLESVSEILPTNEALRINDIITYYVLLKKTNIELEKDVINLSALAASNLELLKTLNDVLKRDVLEFLISLIEYNINSVKDVRRLG